MTDQTVAENQDEIDKIMSEIEELQQEMSAVADPKPAAAAAPAPTPAPPAAAAVAPTPTPAPAPTPASAEVSEEPLLETSEEASQEISQAEIEEIMAEATEGEPEGGSPTAQELEQGILKEFSGEGEEPWLEETLANLKPEAESTTGEGLLDVPSEEFSGEEGSSGAPDAIGDPEDFEAELAEQRKVVQLIPTKKTQFSTDMDGAILGMTVQGKMTIQLNYEDALQVTVGFHDDSVLIQLSDGTEFKIPTKRNTSKKPA